MVSHHRTRSSAASAFRALLVLSMNVAALLHAGDARAHAYTPWGKAGPWELRYDSTSGLCLGTFDGSVPSATGKVTFSVGLAKQISSGAQVFAYAQTPALDLFGAKLIVFAGDQQKFSKATVTDNKDESVNLKLSDEEFDGFIAGDGMVITDLLGKQLAGFRYSAGDRVIPLLRRCAREHANIDKGSGKIAVTKPTLLPTVLITADDYPVKAARESAQGRTRVELTVSAQGKVSDCRVTGSSGHELLDEATCLTLSRRARFTPATDQEGHATEARYEKSVTWNIPPS